MAASQGTSLEHYLSFNRVGSAGFRIHVAIVTVRDTSEETGKAGTQEKLNEERILWTSCNREMKLKAFEKLPDLLDSIISGAESLLQTADSTATKIRQMVGEEDEKEAEESASEELERALVKRSIAAEGLLGPRRRARSPPVFSGPGHFRGRP